jgi:hypothetical protein
MCARRERRRSAGRLRAGAGDRDCLGHWQQLPYAYWLLTEPPARLSVMAELKVIVADYLEQAATWDVIPAAGSRPLLAENRESGR